MMEFVRVGSAEETLRFRDLWMERATRMCALLGLPPRIEIANDPFFGDAGDDMAARQRDSALKFEMLLPAGPGGTLRACMSFNAHRDHCGAIWSIRQHDGSVAHTACVGFGLKRLTLALFCQHGEAIESWPFEVRNALGLGTGSATAGVETTAGVEGAAHV